MIVNIKQFKVEMEVKNSGLEFEIRSTQGEHLGDLVVTKTNLIWCEGRTRRGNGKSISWEDFRHYMSSR